MTRAKWDALRMAQVELLALRSADNKHQVAAIITDRAHRTVAEGVNGRHRNAADEGRYSPLTGHSEMIHAEINALARVPQGTQLGTMYLTHEPCHSCALAILAQPQWPARVLYARPYVLNNGCRRGSDVLREAGVTVEEISDREHVDLIVQALQRAGGSV